MNFGLSDNTISKLKHVLSRHSKIKEVLVYGSRAKGNYKEGSDIDLAIKGENFDYNDLVLLMQDLDELNLPYEIDIVNYSQIDNPDLIDHIDRVGKILYRKE